VHLESRKAAAGRWAALVAVIAFVVLAVQGYAAVPRPTGECPLRFAVVGDRTNAAVPGKYEEAIAEIERLKPDLAITVGDMIQGYTGDTLEIIREWKEYKDLIKPLTMPIYFTPGNHDITQPAVMAQYRQMIGEPYHSFDVRGVHFVVLDNGRYPTVEDFPREQLEWLRDDLAAHQDAAYTFVFFHIPYWLETIATGKSDPLHDLFVERGVDAVFTGHNHEYFSGKFDGVTYIGVGASGGEAEPGLTGLEHHFVWVTVDDKQVSISPVALGAVRAWDDVTAADQITAYKVGNEGVEVGRVRVGSALTCPPVTVKVTVKNVLPNAPLKAAMRWTVPAGWTVTPTEASQDVAPLASTVVDFSVVSTASIYPAPVLTVDYPISEGKTRRVQRPLPIARTAYAYRTERPPKIDGKLDEALWKDPVSNLFAPDGSSMTGDPVSFYFAWDRGNLYVAARCTEKEPGSIVAACKDRDCAVYAEDCVGYFLEPNVADGPVYQVYFSALGTAFDQKISVKGGWSAGADPKWNGRYEVKTSRGADFWSIEARIPMKELGAKPKTGDAWALNFRRKQKRLNSSADWQVPTGYDPVAYGILQLK
jgi:predicted phosphodiesterase